MTLKHKNLQKFFEIFQQVYEVKGADALRSTSDVDQRAVLMHNRDYLLNTLDLRSLEIHDSHEGDDKTQEACAPGRPFIEFMVKSSYKPAVRHTQ